MELKLSQFTIFFSAWGSFNRTFMELKLNSFNHLQSDTIVLIVPLWN